MQLKWVFPNQSDIVTEKKLTEELNIPVIISRILINRGLTTVPRCQDFLNPQLKSLISPFLMDDLERAVTRISVAIDHHEHIMLFGDYDVDGITGIALLYLVLKEIGAQVSYYVPERLKEGYGFSVKGVQEAQQRGATLIITIDCGVTATQEINYAHNLGIDVIVTDHHEPGDELPQAIAVLNPKRVDSDYPFKELAGVGIAFKLSHGLLITRKVDPSILVKHLELVAIGSIADIVPLVEENRILAKVGLNKLPSTNKIGLRKLIETAGLKGKPIDTGHVMYIIAPRINAVGRIGLADSAVKLLITQDDAEATKLAQELETENQRRKEIDERILNESVQMVESTVNLAEERAIVLASEQWHPGVIGIVASRIVERYYRPTVLICIDGDKCKGSARSIPGFHLYEALKDSQEFLTGFGGHKHAAGLTLETKSIPKFQDKFRQIAARKLTDDDLIPKLQIDSFIQLKDIDSELIKNLKLFEPFGPQNLRPVFAVSRVQVVGNPQVVGNNHIKFRVRDENTFVEAIGFGKAELINNLEMGKTIMDIAFVLEENQWQGITKLQLHVKDIRIL